MPLPEPMSLNEELSTLVSHLGSGKPLGDIRRFHIKNKLDACLDSSTADAHCGLAFLAAIDGDEATMRSHFRSVFECAPENPGYEFNFGLLLMLTKHSDEAIKAFMQSLAHGLCDPALLNDLAEDALILGDADLQLEVLNRGNKLQCSGPGMLRLASLVCCAKSDDPNEQDAFLACAFPDDDLKANSEPITEQDWLHMQSFADSLRKYL